MQREESRAVILAEDSDKFDVVAALARADVHIPVALGGKTLMSTFTHGRSALPWRTFPLPKFG